MWAPDSLGAKPEERIGAAEKRGPPPNSRLAGELFRKKIKIDFVDVDKSLV